MFTDQSQKRGSQAGASPSFCCWHAKRLWKHGAIDNACRNTGSRRLDLVKRRRDARKTAYKEPGASPALQARTLVDLESRRQPFFATKRDGTAADGAPLPPQVTRARVGSAALVNRIHQRRRRGRNCRVFIAVHTYRVQAAATAAEAPRRLRPSAQPGAGAGAGAARNPPTADAACPSADRLRPAAAGGQRNADLGTGPAATAAHYTAIQQHRSAQSHETAEVRGKPRGDDDSGRRGTDVPTSTQGEASGDARR